MTFISYAQNFEDIMLWRALKHIQHGVYIDIGAQDPTIDSVSLAFYEHGWQGVHVEPTQQYSDKLRMARPDETVLQLAIGNEPGDLTFYEFENTGLSTADLGIAKRHQEAGFKYKETRVQVISLDALFRLINVNEVHWLKLDVEGMEASVLTSWRGPSILPWILVIESTQPLTQLGSHEDWEHIVLDKGYRYAYSDGLNRFYVSPEHLELIEIFKFPPNFFDNFFLSDAQPFCHLTAVKAHEAETKAHEAETKAHEAETKAHEAETKAHEAECKNIELTNALERVNADLHLVHQSNHQHWLLTLELQQQIQSIRNSLSMRITYPLRWTGSQIRRLRHEGPKSRCKALIKKVFRYIHRQIVTRPHLFRRLVMLTKKCGLYCILKGLYFRFGLSAANTPPAIANMLPVLAEVPLSPRALRIYLDLKEALDRKQEGMG